MIRRFVNIVAEKGRCGSFSLHRLDASKHLFYPSMVEAEAANKNSNGKTCSELPQLPLPVVRFEPYSPKQTPLWKSLRLEMFAPVSPRSHDGEDRIFCINTVGNTIMYNADSGTIQTMPPLNGGKGFMPIVMSIPRPGARAAPEEEDIYVMRSIGHRDSSFDVLRFDGHRIGNWHWDSLPPVPVPASIRSHTVVDGGSTICVSAAPKSNGERVTYYFDLTKCEWRQAKGGWVLPFEGRADYVPDLNMWLGFSTDDSMHLCAWDISAMDEPPRLLHAWTDLETTPDPDDEEWSVSSVNLVDLGSGRFCVAKMFGVGESFDTAVAKEDRFAVLTGVEMVTTDGGSPEQHSRLRMVKHKSVRCVTGSQKSLSGGCCRSVRVYFSW